MLIGLFSLLFYSPWCCHSTIHLHKYAFHHFYSVEYPGLKRSYRLMNRFSFLKGTDFDIAVERRVVVYSWKNPPSNTMFKNPFKSLILQKKISSFLDFLCDKTTLSNFAGLRIQMRYLWWFSPSFWLMRGHLPLCPTVSRTIVWITDKYWNTIYLSALHWRK